MKAEPVNDNQVPPVPSQEEIPGPPPKVFICKTVDLRVDGKAVIRAHCRTTNKQVAVTCFLELVALGENAWLIATDDQAPDISG